ncbi:hypothetical protein JZ751_004479 [Albula glossodonta]|uniref:Disintegrin and metalloproteinase domain-containing protein 23-like n=1 Tax=Albula glossodonta TaxID=121402 RepID=A0A8T2N593_9TELE|nr:hypothetical protein JZ751_004479 [Albula glossodonta]
MRCERLIDLNSDRHALVVLGKKAFLDSFRQVTDWLVTAAPPMPEFGKPHCHPSHCCDSDICKVTRETCGTGLGEGAALSQRAAVLCFGGQEHGKREKQNTSSRDSGHMTGESRSSAVAVHHGKVGESEGKARGERGKEGEGRKREGDGMFDDGTSMYLIEPLHQTHSIADSPEELMDPEQSLSELADVWWLRRRKKRAMPRNVFEEMKYLEIMIVSDHSMYKRHKTKQLNKNMAKSVVNLVDAVFKEQLHTRVVLVAMEMWTERDQIPITLNPLEMLRDFAKYRQQSIKQHADAVHLFSGAARRTSLGCARRTEELESTSMVLHGQWLPLCPRAWRRTWASSGIWKARELFQETECGNGYVEVGEECDCGGRECYKDCCKKCSLSNGAHCSDGPCCNNTCLFYPRGYSCRYAVNDCDISETCSGDSGQCPPNLHKQDGYSCQLNQKFCYEKLNTEGTEKGNCGKDGDKWIQCGKHDVFCGYLLCTNIGRTPRIGHMKGDITPTSFNHQGRVVDCSGGHVLLDDETDLGYVEDGTPCGPSMMCLDRKCLLIQSLNMSTCPSGSNGQVCSAHGVCNNEGTCTCDTTWAGTDCSMPDPPKPPPPEEDDGPKGPSATNLIIGSIAGAILVAAIVLGGTGWGFKNAAPPLSRSPPHPTQIPKPRLCSPKPRPVPDPPVRESSGGFHITYPTAPPPPKGMTSCTEC